MNSSLSTTIGDLNHATSVDQVAEIALSAARRFTGADGATLVFREGDFCHYADERAIAPLWKGSRFPMSACISGWVMMHRERAIIPDISKDPRIPFEAYRPTFVRSLCMTPVGRDEPRAAIGAYWQDHHAVTEDQCFLLSILADAMDLALKRIHSSDGLRKSLALVEQNEKVKPLVAKLKKDLENVGSPETARRVGEDLKVLGRTLVDLVPLSGAYFTSFDLLESVVSELQGRSGFRIEYETSPILVCAERNRTNALMTRLAGLFESHAANRVFASVESNTRYGILSFVGPQLKRDLDPRFLMEIACYLGAHDGEFEMDFYEGSFVRLKLAIPSAEEYFKATPAAKEVG